MTALLADALAGIDTVLVDADDTLWENNIYFLQSLEWLCSVGRRLGFTDYATGRILHNTELRNIPHLGFGYDSYEASLLETVRALCHAAPGGGGEMHPAFRQQALQWTHFLRRHPIVLRPGVAEVLPMLAQSYPTILVTKGHHGDQMGKVLRSGLLELFKAVEVVPNKKPDNYRALIAKYHLDPARTVMIGNAPGSDINSARRAGLRTLYIPHPQTWEYEMEPIEVAEPHTVHLQGFQDLRRLLSLP